MLKRRIGLLLLFAILTFTGCVSSVEEGSSLLEERKYAEAQKKFQASVDEGKELAEAYRGLGICYWEQENYEEALAAFEQALNEGAEPTATLYNLAGISALKMGDAGHALFYFEEGQAFEGASEELLQEMAFNVIVCYEELDEYELAKEKLDEYLLKYPDDEKAVKEQEFLSTQS